MSYGALDTLTQAYAISDGPNKVTGSYLQRVEGDSKTRINLSMHQSR